MSSMSPHVLDVSAADFDEAVLRRSHEVPVLVDFWAPWCGPCRALGPTLERLAVEMDGAFVLARINSDSEPELAARYRVQGIPNVLLFRGGKPVDGFVGALPETAVRGFLRPFCLTAADRLAEDGARALANGDHEAARRAFEGALRLDPDCPAARLFLARLAFAEGDLETTRRHVAAIPAHAREYDAGQSLLKAEGLALAARSIGDREACAARLESDPGDLEARYALGAHAAVEGRHRDALEHFLELARADKEWHDQAARRAMVTVFDLLGARHPVSDEYRDQLRSLYY